MAQGSKDEQILRQGSRLFQICSQRSQQSSPIFRLPVEILSSIFLHYARDYHADDHDPIWINVSHVCSHWRNVALRFPALWGHIDVRPDPWTDELLARSKNTLLRIRVSSPDYHHDALLERVMEHTGRIQELELDLPDTRVLPMLSSPAHQLQTLSIRIPAHINFDFNFDESFVPFKGDTPALRVLDLTDCPMSLRVFKLDCLTTLIIQGTNGLFPHRMEKFLDILGDMPHLDTLCLLLEIPGSQEFVSSGALDKFPKVDLPCLSTIRVYSQLSAVVAFVSCTNIPINAELELECFHESNADDIALLSSVLRNRYSASKDSPTIRSLGIASRCLGQRRIVFCTSECNFDTLLSGPDEMDSSVPLMITLTGCDLEVDGNVDYAESTMCFCMPLGHVQSIYSYKPPLSSEFWGGLLERTPDVRSIKLSSGYMPHLASLLSSVPVAAEENRVARAHRMYAIALEELDLYQITAMWRPPKKDERVVDYLEFLEDALGSRPGPAVRLVVERSNLEGPEDFSDLFEVEDEDGADETMSDGSGGMAEYDSDGAWSYDSGFMADDDSH